MPIDPITPPAVRAEELVIEKVSAVEELETPAAGDVAIGALTANLFYKLSNGTTRNLVDSNNAAGYGLSAPVAAAAIEVNSTTYALAVANKSIINLTGDTAGRKITSITGGTNGQIIALHFGDGNVTLGTGAAKVLGAVDFLGANHDTVILAYNGTEWAEVGRQQQTGLNGALGQQTPEAAAVTTLNASGLATLALALLTGLKGASTARTATSAGATTGTIAAGTSFVTAANGGSADNIIVLPDATAVVFQVVVIYTTGALELRTSSPTTISINGGSGSNAESAIPSGAIVIAIQVTATAWLALQIASNGTVGGVEAAA